MRRHHYTERDFSTKEAARASLLRLLEPLKPFYSEGGARVDIGVTSAHYENDSIPMEAFARPLWGLIPFWMGGGSEPDFEDLYRKGFENGPNPEHPEYWHTGRDYDQKFCEMAAVSYGILLTPEKIWEPLSPRGKDNLVEWLWEINRYECVASNWQWFCIMANLALKSVGRPYSRERLDFGLGLMEEYYDAGGWYHDGAGGGRRTTTTPSSWSLTACSTPSSWSVRSRSAAPGSGNGHGSLPRTISTGSPRTARPSPTAGR